MKTRNKMLVIALVITLLLSMTTMVKAYSASLNASTSSKLVEGSEVVVNVRLNPTDVGEGVDTVIAELKYDKDVFEVISTSSFTSASGWKDVSYEPSSDMLTIQKSSKVTNSEALFTLTLKVKQTISKDSTTIYLNDIIVSGGREVDGGTGDIEVANTSITISRETQSASQPGKIIPVKSDSTTAKTKSIPQTGVDYTVVIAIVAVAIIGTISATLYLKKRDIR